MVEKFEVGKSYKCIDVNCFVEAVEFNTGILSKYFDKDNVVFVDGITVFPNTALGGTSLRTPRVAPKTVPLLNLTGSSLLVSRHERHLFEEVIEEVIEETPTFTRKEEVDCTITGEYVTDFDDSCLVMVDGKLMLLPKTSVKKK